MHISTLRLEGVYLGRDGHYTDETSPMYYLYKNQVWEYLWTSQCKPVDAETMIQQISLRCSVFRPMAEKMMKEYNMDIDLLRIHAAEALVKKLEEVVAEGKLCTIS